MELQLMTRDQNELPDQQFSIRKGPVDNSGLHSQLLMEHTQLKKKVDMLRQENKKGMEDWFLLKHLLEELKLICKDREEETSDLQTQQQQEFERLEESLQFLLKQKEMITREKNLTQRLQPHFEVSQMRSEKLIHELEQAKAQDENLLQKELLIQEPPAEPHIQQILNYTNAFSSSNFISCV